MQPPSPDPTNQSNQPEQPWTLPPQPAAASLFHQDNEPGGHPEKKGITGLRLSPH
jgi:hypothetical protein